METISLWKKLYNHQKSDQIRETVIHNNNSSVKWICNRLDPY